jgi:hypothetical protein
MADLVPQAGASAGYDMNDGSTSVADSGVFCKRCRY